MEMSNELTLPFDSIDTFRADISHVICIVLGPPSIDIMSFCFWIRNYLIYERLISK